MLREFSLAGRMAERVGPDGLALHDAPPVRAAATVMLLRDGPGGPEVFAFRRVPRMAFAAGMVVFPGGSLDPADADPAVPFAAPAPPELRPVLAAAVRETFEECGVLPALDRARRPPDAAELASPAWEARRTGLAAGTVTLAEVLTATGLEVAAGLLRPWARWVTPPFEHRRFDTWFFAAALPPGQEARDLGGEGERAAWLRPAEAVQRHRAGELPMLPPTLVCLEELAAAPSVEAVLATPRQVRPVSPWVAREGDRLVLRIDLDGRGGGEPGPAPGAASEHSGEPRELDRWRRHARGALRPGAQPGADDARRHEHVGAVRARRAGPSSSTPGPATRVTSPPSTGPSWPGARATGIVLLTHGHLDHSEGARAFAERAGVGVRALDPAHRLGDEGLAGGYVVELDGLRVDVVATPGHTGDSLSFVLPETGALLTGDTVLGRGTTVVAHPDGRLGAYLDSLHRLADLADRLGLADLLPGHGPALRQPLEVVRAYLRHRAERLEQVRAAVQAGARTPRRDRRARLRRRPARGLARRRASVRRSWSTCE